jgi:radical SAM superfamily enzyme YgiQ (UPF0313 family)
MVRGILYHEDGRLVQTPAREQIKDLSAQPWPDRESIDMARYLDVWKKHHGASSVSLITSRGCPYTCNWCSHSVFGFTHRRRKPDDVVEEVAWIKERYGPDQLWYADDVLTIHPRWFLQYASLLKARGLHLSFECISRADRLNEGIIDALADMGCYRLWIGAESGSQRILDAMERKANVEDIQAKAKMVQARGIEVGMFIMLGYAGEQIADLEETVDHLKRSNPDVFLTTVAYPIKGTKYYDQVESRIAANAAWEARTDRNLIVQGRHSRQFYEHATRWMVNEVNLHKARQAGSRDLGRMAKMWANARRGRMGMRLSSRAREDAGTPLAGGRGWSARDRAEEGW